MRNPRFLLTVVGLRDPSADFHECRDCGYCVDPDSTECPMCGSQEIAVYNFN